MKTKLTSLIFLLVIATSFGQVGWGDPIDPWVVDDIESRAQTTEMPCDQPVCVDPCPSAAPPRYCPLNVTRCESGCACMLECRSPTYVCFQTKFCVSRRRYLDRKPTPAVF